MGENLIISDEQPRHRIGRTWQEECGKFVPVLNSVAMLPFHPETPGIDFFPPPNWFHTIFSLAIQSVPSCKRIAAPWARASAVSHHEQQKCTQVSGQLSSGTGLGRLTLVGTRSHLVPPARCAQPKGRRNGPRKTKYQPLTAFTKQECKCLARQLRVQETGAALLQRDGCLSVSRQDRTLWRMHKTPGLYGISCPEKTDSSDFMSAEACHVTWSVWVYTALKKNNYYYHSQTFPLVSCSVACMRKPEYYLWNKALFHSCSLMERIFRISWSGRWFMCNKELSNASPGYSRFITHCTLEPSHDASYKGWFCIPTLMMPILRAAGIEMAGQNKHMWMGTCY